MDGHDLYGDGVNIAARLQEVAEPGGVAVSDDAYRHLRGKLDVEFDDIGERTLKNISDPVRTWCWQVDGERPASEDGGPTPASILSDKASIAVLPFANMSDSREFEYLADGLTEDLITLLARMPGFFVIARNSTFAYKGQAPDIRTVAQELDVRYVVEGSLRPIGRKIRVTVQLIEAETRNHIWAEQFDRAAEDLDDIEDEITVGIAARLEPELARAEIERIKRRPPCDMDAWSYYQQAHGLLSLKGWHRETFQEAADLLEQAITLDPDFALAHAYLSLLLALGHIFGMAPGDGPADDRAVAEAEHAMGIDAQDSTVLGFAGCALCDVGQTSGGIEILERAVESNPSNAQAWAALGVALMREGKPRKGVEMLRHGMKISPLDNRLAYWGTNLAYVLFRLRKVEEALDEIERACRRDDRLYMARVVRAIILSALGRDREADRAIEEAKRIHPGLRIADVRTLVGRRGIEILEQAELLTA